MTQNAERRMRVQDGQVTDDLDPRQMAAEDLMLGMRMSQGVSQELIDRTSALIPRTSEVIDDLVERGLAYRDDGRLKPTKQGWLCGNELYGALLDLAP